MRKQIKIKKEATVNKFYCDCCGKEFHWGICANQFHSCWVCGNEMCDDCRRQSPVDNDQDCWHRAHDEERFICKDCEKTFSPYAKKMNQLWNTYLEEKDKVLKQYREFRKQEKKK